MGAKPTLRRNRNAAMSRSGRSGQGWGRLTETGRAYRNRPCLLAVGLAAAVSALLAFACVARASTYVVYIALDDPVYQELDTLNGLGLLDDYLSEVKPIARVEAARLTLEAEENLNDSEHHDVLALSIIKSMREEFSEEIEWLENNHEDNPPTMLHPLDRVETQYIYSSGTRRKFDLYIANPRQYQAQEGTPLLPNNDGLPTSEGSNEILRISNWAGMLGFMTAYGETSIAGPLARSPTSFEQSFARDGTAVNSPSINQTTDTNRVRLMRGGVVASIGNEALAFGYQEMNWGTGYFNALSQGNNARPFPALMYENVHPSVLPGFLRYLGPFRHEIFIGQLDHGRYALFPATQTTAAADLNYSNPWISGQVIAFKPLPTFELGLDHVIMFGGNNNNNYSWTGWVGRATGLATGSPCTLVPGTQFQCIPGTSANTNSRAGIFLKIYLPSLRNSQVYQEVLGEDNLSTEVRPIGGLLPFLSVSYQGGVYIPRVTADGLTDARFEYAIIEPNYSTHSDSLYWAYHSQLMGDAMGPDSSEVDLSVGRWFKHNYKGVADVFYTERAPNLQVAGLSKERSGGIAIDVLRIPGNVDIRNYSILGSLKVRAACEYVHDLNWERDRTDSVRTMVLISGSLWPTGTSWIWH